MPNPNFPLRLLLTVLLICAANGAVAAALSFDAATNNAATVSATRDAWLAAIGISTPQHLVDFESGFADGQNISGVANLFPGGLVITDTDAGAANIEGTAGGIGGSNPVNNFAVEQNERPFLELDFSASPVDYVGFRDIDHTGTLAVVLYVGGATEQFFLDGTNVGGNSAEFFALYRNDMPQIVRVQLDSSGDNIWAIDNIEYGAVPLPASLWLLAGALGLGAAWPARGRATARLSPALA